MDNITEIQGTTMDDASAREFLREQGVGVLSLADAGRAYGIPISYGYDADTSQLYFLFLRPGETSKKKRFAEATTRASFVVWDAPTRHEWTSVVAEGTLRAVDDEEWPTARDAIDDNAWFPTLFSETEPMQDIIGWALEIETVSGMQSRDASRSA